MASAPAMTVTVSAPATMSVAARLTNHWGLFPPTVVASHVAAPVPIRPSSSVAGAGPVRVMMFTTDSRSTRPLSTGTVSRAASQARSIRSIGVTN